MKRLVITGIVICLGLGLRAQSEVGVSFGTSHLLGDFGGGLGNGTIFLKDLDFQSTAPSLGVFYRYNFATILGIRAQFLYGSLNSNDLYSANNFRYERALMSKSPLFDFSTQFELNFIPLQLCANNFKITPYVAGGVGVSRVNPVVKALNQEGFAAEELEFINQQGALLAFNVPMSFGVKIKTKQQLIIGLETSYRLSFTDKLDAYERQQKDQFFFINLNVSYVFCKGSKGRKLSNEMRCPSYN